jgi:hypothetical protein
MSWCWGHLSASPPASVSFAGRVAGGGLVRGNATGARRSRFPGHIACDAASASELVVPVMVDGRVVAVIDLDSPVSAIRCRGCGRD